MGTGLILVTSDYPSKGPIWFPKSPIPQQPSATPSPVRHPHLRDASRRPPIASCCYPTRWSPHPHSSATARSQRLRPASGWPTHCGTACPPAGARSSPPRSMSCRDSDEGRRGVMRYKNLALGIQSLYCYWLIDFHNIYGFTPTKYFVFAKCMGYLVKNYYQFILQI